MCGRYSFSGRKKSKLIKDEDLDVKIPDQLEISFNIAPTHRAYVITNDNPGQLSLLHWGLIPAWNRDPVLSGKLINARQETIFTKPSFESAILQRRCLIPADSFYEWRTVGKDKKPFRILEKSEDLLFLAGIWESNDYGDNSIQTFSIITCPANKDVKSIHDRMPLILYNKEQREAWLSNLDQTGIEKLLVQPPANHLVMYGITQSMNSPSFTVPEIHDRINDSPTLF